MKSSAPDWDGSNSSGFSGLPGGERRVDGNFGNAGEYGYWWSSSLNSSDAEAVLLYSSSPYLTWFIDDQRFGFSVRCVRD
jgi:uncharacterized protein (TIGR02145 family)